MSDNIGSANLVKGVIAGFAGTLVLTMFMMMKK
ncbi:MAG: hypothetical protein ACJAVV_003689 [Alphaproteobacteria bacterium]|jgi:hypothetical protein